MATQCPIGNLVPDHLVEKVGSGFTCSTPDSYVSRGRSLRNSGWRSACNHATKAGCIRIGGYGFKLSLKSVAIAIAADSAMA